MSRTNYNCLSFMAIKCLHKFTLQLTCPGLHFHRSLCLEQSSVEGKGVPRPATISKPVLRHNSKRTENSALPCRDGCPI